MDSKTKGAANFQEIKCMGADDLRTLPLPNDMLDRSWVAMFTCRHQHAREPSFKTSHAMTFALMVVGAGRQEGASWEGWIRQRQFAARVAAAGHYIKACLLLRPTSDVGMAAGPALATLRHVSACLLIGAHSPRHPQLNVCHVNVCHLKLLAAPLALCVCHFNVCRLNLLAYP
jgi:hypothetical protein